MPTPFIGFNQYLVGDDVELFLHFALNVFTACSAQDAGCAAQRALVDGLTDAFAGAGNHFKQQTQLGRNVAFLALLFNQVAGEGDVFGHLRFQSTAL